MRKKIINPEFTINTLHVVREILFYLPQYFYNYFFGFIYRSLIAANGRYPRANMRRKDKFKNSKLVNTSCLSDHLIQLVLYNLYTTN